MEKQPIYIASCSFGKDSIATILLALEHNEPLDRVVFSEVMFDIERNISGEIPEHIEWIYNVAKPRLEALWGGEIDIVRAKTDYITSFMHLCSKGKAKGYTQGFPIGGRCRINRDCKLKPIHDYYKQFGERSVVQYVGIAIDEPNRLERMHKASNKVSLLEKYEVTEAMAKEMCRKRGLLSPIYDTGTRGGCWFCPNMRKRTMCDFRKNHPQLWNELRRLGKVENLISHGFKYGKTIEQVDKELDAMDSQLKLEL